MAAGDIDQASLALIIQLQLQDVQHHAQGKGKGRASRCDLDVAMQLYQAELESLEAFATDRVLSVSESYAHVQTGGGGGGRGGTGGTGDARRDRGKRKASAADIEHDDTKVIAKMKALYVDDSDPIPGTHPESSSWAASRRQPQPPQPQQHSHHNHHHHNHHHHHHHPPSSSSVSGSSVSYSISTSSASASASFPSSASLAAVSFPASSASASAFPSAASLAQRTPRPYHLQQPWIPNPVPVSVPVPVPARRTCTACTDDFYPHDILRCPCSHEYCGTCISGLFSAALVDESLFPPRCCAQPIPVAGNEHFLGYKLCRDFAAKQLEYSTPNRTYCHMPACSTFIPPGRILTDTGYCPQCPARTCTTCKGPAHAALDCPADTQTQDLLRMARRNGWQRCRQCRRMVELNTGCNHISCHCGYQFCYVCGALWKTCTCPQWDERMLIERAANVAQRDAPAQGYNPGRLAQAIDQLQQFLQDNHDCLEHHWKSRMGRHRCEECRKMMPTYIYECSECRILACRQCRFNRL